VFQELQYRETSAMFRMESIERPALGVAARVCRVTRFTLLILVSLSFIAGACASAKPSGSHTSTRSGHHEKTTRHRHGSSGRHRRTRTATSSSSQFSEAKVQSTVSAMRVVSYYPQQNPWGGMWTTWKPSVIDADLGRIAGLGANTVRIFLQPGAFGYPTPQAAIIERLSEFLTMAAAHGLQVQLTLFDTWNDYTDIDGSRTWAAAILDPLRDDTTIAAVELQNEIDPTDATAMAWARAMLPVIRTDADRPVTVSVTGWNTATPLQQLITALDGVKPDFYDLHFYGTPPYMLPTFQSAKQIAGGSPVIIGETGYSTSTNNTTILPILSTTSEQDQEQVTYYTDVERAAYNAGLPRAGIWTLNDFPPMAHVDAIEQNFGLYNLNGTAKPAVALIQSVFSSAW
jgi:endo-1,4-beta-mannosidase